MFTRKEMKMFEGDYFTVIRQEEKYIEVCSRSTGHCWIVAKETAGEGMCVILYHKHTADTEYYHKHYYNTQTVKRAVDAIRNHDDYVIGKA